MNKEKAKNVLKIEIDNEKLKKIVLYLLAFLIPVIFLVIIFIYLKVYPFGKNMYLPVDAYGQYINYLQYFRDLFFGESSIFYSLGKALGGEMYGLFAYYLISPYNFITLLFNKGNLPLAFDIILILKTATCSLTFLYYLNRGKKAKFSNLIFAFMYAFSSYSITYGFNIMWLDAVILLPLVIAGIENIIQKKKPVLYIISLALTLITNYYIGFMVCVFSVIYYIYIMILNSELKNKKEILKKIGIFAMSSICAGLISGIILIPAFLGLQGGRADFTFSEINLEKNFEIQNVISKFYTNAFDVEELKNDSMPPVFCGVLANVLVISFFLNNKIRLKDKLLTLTVLIIFAISFYIKGINLLWSIGNIPAWYVYRYTFCFTFMFIITAKKRF